MEEYTKKVMKYFANPQNVGKIEDASGVGNVGNPTCGDIMRLYIKVEDGIITDAKFKTFGCAAAIASSSVLTELIKGKTVDEALKVSNEEVITELGGLPNVKRHCSVLAKEALESAVKNYQERQNK